MSEIMKAVPKIARLREHAGLTQLELSLLVGVTENTIQNWEKGKAGVEQIERLIRLCRILKCNLEDLIEYVPDAEPEKSKSKRRSLVELRKLLDTAEQPSTSNTDISNKS
jgi:transcriptional regulator with XRE-family HTH domain